jgi:hypothetical protein
MVRRLKLDQNKDINMPLRHIELAPVPQDALEIFEMSEANLDRMRRKSLESSEEGDKADNEMKIEVAETT